MEFGEKVLWKFPFQGLEQKMEKINARWGCGLFIDRGGPGDQEHQVHPYGAACSSQGPVVVRQFAVGCNCSVEQRER